MKGQGGGRCGDQQVHLARPEPAAGPSRAMRRLYPEACASTDFVGRRRPLGDLRRRREQQGAGAAAQPAQQAGQRRHPVGRGRGDHHDEVVPPGRRRRGLSQQRLVGVPAQPFDGGGDAR